MFQGLVCDTNIFRMYVIFSEQHAAGYGCLSKFTHDICVSEKMIGNYAKNFKKTSVEETLLKHCSRIKAVFSARPHSCFFANVNIIKISYCKLFIAYFSKQEMGQFIDFDSHAYKASLLRKKKCEE